MVDSLDSLWIFGLYEDFYEAAEAATRLDWAKTEQTSANMFETTIRYLGGLLSAHDLSGELALLEKAQELGDMLYMCVFSQKLPTLPAVSKANDSRSRVLLDLCCHEP